MMQTHLESTCLSSAMCFLEKICMRSNNLGLVQTRVPLAADFSVLATIGLVALTDGFCSCPVHPSTIFLERRPNSLLMIKSQSTRVIYIENNKEAQSKKP